MTEDLIYAPDMSADINCLIKLFPAHEEVLRQSIPFQAMYFKGMKPRAATRKLIGGEKGTLAIRVSSDGMLEIRMAFTKVRARFLEELINAQHTFPNFIEHLSGFSLRLHNLKPDFDGLLLAIRFPAGLLPVFFTALVGTKLFQLMRVHYLTLLEEQNAAE